MMSHKPFINLSHTQSIIQQLQISQPTVHSGIAFNCSRIPIQITHSLITNTDTQSVLYHTSHNYYWLIFRSLRLCAKRWPGKVAKVSNKREKRFETTNTASAHAFNEPLSLVLANLNWIVWLIALWWSQT